MFIPIELSPGEEVYIGTLAEYAAESRDFCAMPSAFSRSRTYLPARL